MPDTGPHVQAATFCESVLQERNGTLSLIRLIDRAVLMMPPEGAPSPPPPPALRIWLVVALRADQAKGVHQIRIQAEGPDGGTPIEAATDVYFESGKWGVNWAFPVNMAGPTEGLYWFNIMLNGTQLLSRVPLEIIYQRAPGLLPPRAQQ